MTLLDDTCNMTLWDAIQSGDVRAVAKQLHPRAAATADKSHVIAARQEGSTDGVRTASAVDPNYDGAPYCSHCGAKGAQWCDCGPLAE